MQHPESWHFACASGEKVVKEENVVWYFGGYSRAPNPILGKLIVTDSRLIFYEEKPKERAGLFSRNIQLAPVGVIMSIPIKALIGVSIDRRLRSKSSKPNWRRNYRNVIKNPSQINRPPGFFDSKEDYSVLILSFDAGYFVENPEFEVPNVEEWVRILTALVSK